VKDSFREILKGNFFIPRVPLEAQIVETQHKLWHLRAIDEYFNLTEMLVGTQSINGGSTGK